MQRAIGSRLGAGLVLVMLVPALAGCGSSSGSGTGDKRSLQSYVSSVCSAKLGYVKAKNAAWGKIKSLTSPNAGSIVSEAASANITALHNFQREISAAGYPDIPGGSDLASILNAAMSIQVHAADNQRSAIARLKKLTGDDLNSRGSEIRRAMFPQASGAEPSAAAKALVDGEARTNADCQKANDLRQPGDQL